MADVTRPPRSPSDGAAPAGESAPSPAAMLLGGRSRTDRGQLFLIGALALAVLFVGLALLLNTAIFTENLATRSTDPGTGQAVGFSEAAERGTSGLLYRANHDPSNTDYGLVETDFERNLGNWSNATALHNTRDARLSSVTVSGYTEGARIEQTDSSRNFSNETGDATAWTLATDTHAREFRMTVEAGSLESTTLASILGGADPFEVRLTNSTGTYHVYVYRQSGEVRVAVERPDGTDAMCGASVGSHADIDLTRGTINDTACPALELLGTLPTGAGDTVDVEYRNGEDAVGTYELTVDDDADVETANLANGAGSAPFHTDAMYAVELDVTYRSSEVYFTETLRVAPGEATS